MKLQGKIELAKEGMLVVDIESNKHLLPRLEPGKSYDINITEHKTQRTINQNRLLWENIDRIAKELQQDLLKTYAEILERADCKSAFMVVKSLEVGESLKKSFRAVQFINKVSVKGQEGYQYKVFFGSSTFNTKEMTQLIDITFDILSELGIYEEEEL